MSNRQRKARAFVLTIVMGCSAALACTKRSPRDFEAQNPKSEFPDGPSNTRPTHDAGPAPTHTLAAPLPGGLTPHEIARASARAIVTSPTQIYFGDDEDDALYALEKTDGGGSMPTREMVRLARRAPMSNALAIDEGGATLAWIGT